MGARERSSTRPLAGTQFHVLLALGDAPRYGLGIAEEVERQTGGAVRPGPGSLYTALHRLLDERLVEEWIPDGETDPDPRRRYYRITPAGREALAAEVAHLDVLVSAAREKGVAPG